jgi:AbrB family looped-hinge helix DNA binding protein
MITTLKTDTVNFGAKGQVVIPRRLRKEFEIEDGTKAQVYEENGHIVLKPITSKACEGR